MDSLIPVSISSHLASLIRDQNAGSYMKVIEVLKGSMITGLLPGGSLAMRALLQKCLPIYMVYTLYSAGAAAILVLQQNKLTLCNDALLV